MNKFISKRQSNYLMELNSIPVEIRQRYINSLFFRKNGTSQKNYKFIIFIDRILRNESFRKYDEELICKKLDISKSMLACMKSRLLKNLRKLYFELNKNEKNFSIEKKLEEIKSLEEKGCYREAMPFCFKLIKEINSESFITKNKNEKTQFYFYLTELYYIQSQFYFFNKKVSHFKRVFKEIEKIKNKVSKFKGEESSRKICDKILIRYYLVKSQLFLFKQGNNKYLHISRDYKMKALEISERIKEYGISIRNLIHLARIFRLTGDLTTAYEIVNKGKYYSKMLSSQNLYELFQVLELELYFIKDKKFSEKYYSKCIEAYNNLSSDNSFECVQTINFKLIGITSFLDKEEEIKFYEREYVRSLALRGKKYEAFERRFWQNAEWQRWNLYKWKIENDSNKEHYSVEPDAKILNEMSEQIVEYTRRNYKIYNSSRMLFNFLFRIDVEYWKGENSDYETILYFINKVNRLVKKTEVSLPKHNYQNIKFLVNLLNESKYKDKKEVFLKYAKDFDEVVDSLKKTTLNVIEEYAKIEFASKILNLKIFSDEVRKLESWLKENRPQLFEPINDLIFKKAV